MTPEQKSKYEQKLHIAYNCTGMTAAVKGYLRYEVVRMMVPSQFHDLCLRYHAGEGTMDELVDLMVSELE